MMKYKNIILTLASLILVQSVIAQVPRPTFRPPPRAEVIEVINGYVGPFNKYRAITDVGPLQTTGTITISTITNDNTQHIWILDKATQSYTVTSFNPAGQITYSAVTVPTDPSYFSTCLYMYGELTLMPAPNTKAWEDQQRIMTDFQAYNSYSLYVPAVPDTDARFDTVYTDIYVTNPFHRPGLVGVRYRLNGKQEAPQYLFNKVTKEITFVSDTYSSNPSRVKYQVGVGDYQTQFLLMKKFILRSYGPVERAGVLNTAIRAMDNPESLAP